jgi:hypothetical protein
MWGCRYRGILETPGALAYRIAGCPVESAKGLRTAGPLREIGAGLADLAGLRLPAEANYPLALLHSPRPLQMTQVSTSEVKCGRVPSLQQKVAAACISALICYRRVGAASYSFPASSSWATRRPKPKLSKNRLTAHALTDLQKELIMCDKARKFGARNSYMCPRKHYSSKKEPPQSLACMHSSQDCKVASMGSIVFSWSIKTTNSGASARRTKS